MSDEEKIAKLQLEMNQSVEEETDRLNEVRERRKNLSRRIRRIELKESPTSDEEDQVYEMKELMGYKHAGLSSDEITTMMENLWKIKEKDWE